MQIFFQELARTVIHWKLQLLIFLELSLFVFVTFALLFNAIQSDARARHYYGNIGDEIRYILSFSDPSMADSENYSDEDAAKVVREIRKNEGLSIYTHMVDSVAIPYTQDEGKMLPEIFEAGYEEGNIPYNEGLQVLKSYIFSSDVFACYDMKISEGRMFTNSDFTYTTGMDYPVLLGAEYREHFNVGDRIPVYHFSQQDTLLVIGFLEEGTLFADMKEPDRPLGSIDRYIIFPYLVNSSDGEMPFENWFDINTSYLEGGTIELQDASISVQDDLNRITNMLGFPPLRADQYTGTQMQSVSNISTRNVFLLGLLAIAIGLLSILTISMVIRRRVEKDLSIYATYVLCGVDPRWLIFVVVFETLLMAALSCVPTIWISYLRFRMLVIPFWQLFLISFPVLFLSSFPAYRLITKINIDQLLRRKSE